MGTVSIRTRTWKDIKMKLLFVLSVTLALSLGDEFETNLQAVEDLETSASVISPRSQDYNLPIANNYNNIANSVAPKLWNSPSNYDSVKPAVPSASVRNYYASENNYNQPENNQYNNNYNQNSWNNPQPSQPSNSWSQNNGWNNQQNPQNNVWNNQQKPQNSGWNNQQKPQNNGWNNQQNAWNQQNSWNQQGSSQNVGAQNNWNKPQNGGSQNSWNKPQNSGSQNNWNAVNNQNNVNQNVPSSSSTTTPVSVIKNEQILGDNGSYKYEYEIADGTHVSEEGYATNVNTQEESIVKKGFYSFTGADGKVYTVTYWADDTGFHAEGDHLPKPHPIPPAIQASIDQNAKEEAAKAEEEKKKQQQQNIYYPQGQEPPKPLAPQQPIQPTPQPVYPQQVYYPPQQTYYPPQNNYYPPQSYGK